VTVVTREISFVLCLIYSFGPIRSVDLAGSRLPGTGLELLLWQSGPRIVK